VTDSWTDRLWADVDGIYDAIREHPFLAGLTDGTLDQACFAYYLAQDAHYLRDYARALAIVAAKAPTHADTGLFAAQAAETIAVELSLHEVLLPQLGVTSADLAAVRISPTTAAYTNYLLATVYAGTFAEGLAAVLPCFWIYQRVGADLIGHGSPDARYQRWIDAYAGEGFATTVNEVLAVADRIGPTLASPEALRAREHFVTTSRYEWMFWDAAWRRENWPV
jgi:thiaminase (transcriptional activator TenA)